MLDSCPKKRQESVNNLNMNVALNARKYEVIKTNNEEMIEIAKKVKAGEASRGEIDSLVRFTIDNQDIEYAYEMMEKYAAQAQEILNQYPDSDVKTALSNYICFVIQRNK